MGLGRNESADASCQCFKAGDSTECSPSSTSLMQNYARCIRAASGGVDASPTSPTPVTAVTCAESGGRSLLPNRVECMAGATLSTVDEPSSPASDGGGKRCHGRATADARPDAVRNESGINCGTLRYVMCFMVSRSLRRTSTHTVLAEALKLGHKFICRQGLIFCCVLAC